MITEGKACNSCQSNHLANNYMITEGKACNSCHKPGHFSKICHTKNKRPAVQRVRSVEVANDVTENVNSETEQSAIHYVKLFEITDSEPTQLSHFL